MKALILAGAFAVTSTAAIAGSSDFLSHIGGPEYDFNYGTHGMAFAPVEESGQISSLNRIIQESNVDGIAWNNFEGEIIEYGPSRISLYEVMRDSPEGIAYRDYHERFPADTDWAQVARDFRQKQLEAQGIAADVETPDGDS